MPSRSKPTAPSSSEPPRRGSRIVVSCHTYLLIEAGRHEVDARSLDHALGDVIGHHQRNPYVPARGGHTGEFGEVASNEVGFEDRIAIADGGPPDLGSSFESDPVHVIEHAVDRLSSHVLLARGEILEHSIGGDMARVVGGGVCLQNPGGLVMGHPTLLSAPGLAGTVRSYPMSVPAVFPLPCPWRCNSSMWRRAASAWWGFDPLRSSSSRCRAAMASPGSPRLSRISASTQ